MRSSAWRGLRSTSLGSSWAKLGMALFIMRIKENFLPLLSMLVENCW